MSSIPKMFPLREMMKPDVYEGGTGKLVICQEWPSLKGDTYTYVMLPMAEAEALANAILDMARGR
jgi:hypothetical protein